MSHSEEIAELQSRVAFQEDAIDKLSAEIARQDKEIEMLTRMIKIMNKNMKALEGDSPMSPQDEPPPPHY